MDRVSERSKQQRQADKDAFRAELTSAGIEKAIEPPHSFSARSIPLDRDLAWYASTEARHIADVIVSFQTPAGGWGKNMDMSKEPRRPGESFTTNNLSRFLTPDDFDAPLEPEWNYVGTIDNDATTTQMNFLAKVISSVAAKDRATYIPTFLRGMEYLFEAQYPNGGWPQVWPLEGGYHDAITYNDDAMTQVEELMLHTANGRNEFAFVPHSVRMRAAASASRGVRCILASQIVVNGTLTVWPQQADPLTLKPESGRNFETTCSERRRKRRVAVAANGRPAVSNQRGTARHPRSRYVVQKDGDLRPELSAWAQRTRACAKSRSGSHLGALLSNWH